MVRRHCKPRLAAALAENFTANQAGGNAEIDLVQDGWTDLARRIREQIRKLPPADRTVPKMPSSQPSPCSCIVDRFHA